MMILFGDLAQYFFGISIFLLSTFLILLILVQRGRGGGLTGALGGPGGQSAFGTKAGDVFTRITIGVAAAWIFLCGWSVFALSGRDLPDTGGGFVDTVSATGDLPTSVPSTDSGMGAGMAPATGIPGETTPATETPAAENPTAETPAAETPEAETPATETPAAESLAPETPAAETPAAETPAAAEPATTPEDPAAPK